MTERFVVIIAGTAGVGKDTFAEMLKETLAKWTSVRADAYAHSLKQVAQVALNVPQHILLSDKSIKESTFVYLGGEPTAITVSKALEDIGTWFRRAFGPLVWASSVRARAEAALERITIITDARHPKEEVHWLRGNCEFAQRVFAVRIRNSRIPPQRGNPNEDPLLEEPDKSFDFLIENEGSLEDLRTMARELARAVVVLVKSGKKKVKRKGHGWGSLTAHAYEPMLTREDAERLYNEPVEFTYFHLKGSACAG